MKLYKKIDAIVEGILNYLEDQKSLDLLPEVAKRLSQQSFVRVDPKLAIVKSPIKLSSTQILNLKKNLSQHFGKGIRVKVNLDQSIIAGLKIEIAGQVIDATINNKLKDLQQKVIYG